jgi:hypothetical protein
MPDFPTYYGILDDNKLRLGFVYTSILELLDQVSEQIIQVTNDKEILKLNNEPQTEFTDLEIIRLHGFEICQIPAYVAEDIKHEQSAVVNMDNQYFYDGSLKFVTKLEYEDLLK